MSTSATQKGRKIRLLIVVDSLDKGGLEEVVLMYARFLDKQKYIVAVTCRTPGLAASEIASIRDVIVSCYDASSIWTRFVMLWRIARAFKPDIVHNHYNWYGVIVGRLVGAKCVETIHNTYHWFTGLKNFAYSVHLLIASKTIAVSEFVRQRATSLFVFVNENNIEVVHNGVDTARFRACEDDNLRETLEIKYDDIVIGFVGRLEEQKGLTYLLKAVKKVSEEFHSVKVVLVGDGTLRQQLEKEAHALQLSNVFFPGFVRETPKYYQMFDVFVLPSLFEGLPMSLVEAMAAGCSVVATKAGGIVEVVEDGVTGILVDPKDVEQLAAALLRVVASLELRTSLGERARSHVMREFSVQTMIARTERVYSELLRS